MASRSDVLGHRAGILLINLQWSHLHVHQRGLDLRMPHQLHESRQADAGPHHIGSKGVAEAVWVGELDASGLAMIAEQRT